MNFRREKPKRDRQQVIFGRRPILEALEGGDTQFDKILLQQGTRGDYEKQVRGAARAANVLVQYVPRQKLDMLTNRQNHQGVVGYVALVRYYELADVLPGIYERGETPLVLLLDGITDTRNFGAIVRSAEICGVHAVVVPAKGGALITPDAVKTSAGAILKMNVCRARTLGGAVELLQNSGIKVLAAELSDRSVSLPELDLRQPVAIVLGAEGQGVNPELSRATDGSFKIPQVGETDSFNVSVAAGITLYEVLRQRGA